MEATESGLKANLEVEMAQENLLLGPLEATVILRNDDARPLWVNGRLLVNSSYAPKPYREVELIIVDPLGIQLEFQCAVRAGQSSPGSYRMLKFGDCVSVKINLIECFDFQKEGLYTIGAIYEDGAGMPPPPPGGSLHLRGPLQSTKKQFRLRSR